MGGAKHAKYECDNAPYVVQTSKLSRAGETVFFQCTLQVAHGDGGDGGGVGDCRGGVPDEGETEYLQVWYQVWETCRQSKYTLHTILIPVLVYSLTIRMFMTAIFHPTL